jgi:hypothetical protein
LQKGGFLAALFVCALPIEAGNAIEALKPFEVGRAMAIVFGNFLFLGDHFDAIADDPSCAA